MRSAARLLTLRSQRPIANRALSSLAPAAGIICGKTISKAIRGEVTEAVTELVDKTGVRPGLAVVLVGARPDSASYVRAKKKACTEIGITDFGFDYGEDVTQEEVIKKVQALNADEAVHGILVQLPLPAHIDEEAVLTAIDPKKDVDGLHPLNTASLASTNTHGARLPWENFMEIPFPVACTPQGCIEMLDRSGVTIQGANAVVIGRSNIVGIPMALLLMQRNATVTIVHSHTNDIPGVVGRADIVVAGVGRAEMVKGDWLKPGATVIDVGINAKPDDSKVKGYRLVGDVDFESASAVAGQITPVPGGVGPLTIAMLMRNVLCAARRRAAELGR